MTTLPQRLRAMADHTGLDAVAELLREAAEQLEREKASRQAAQIENEALKERIARSGVEQQRAVLAEREACARVCDSKALTWRVRPVPLLGYSAELEECAAIIRARGAAPKQEGEAT